jgi:SulP family sulfate permease
MMGGRHKPDCELVAQGIGCAASVLFGGIPSTGAVARTAANVKVGGQTPVSGMVHALTLLLIMVFCSSLVGKIPMAGLCAVLMVVAWNMAEVHRFVHIFKAPRGDVAVMLTAFVLTVLVDLSFAVQTAMLLALFLFMKRITEKHGKIDLHPQNQKEVEIYEVQGPLFFGIADRFRDLAHPSNKAKAFVLRMNDVLLLDASGMHAISDLLDRCQKNNKKLMLAGAHEETKIAFERYGLLDRIGKENFHETVEQAIEAERRSSDPRPIEITIKQT